MTQLTNFNESFSNQNSNFLHYNFNSHQPSEPIHYYVREPNGKRPFPAEFELDMEYIPRTKRRFDKISACLENFSISNDKPLQMNLCRESSSDEEMDEDCADSEFKQDTESSSVPLVVEPDDEPAVAKKIRLDESIQRYFEKCRQDSLPFLPKKDKLKGNEMVIWQPRILISPKNDFNMSGRIQEIDDDEEERVNESIKAKIIENEGMVDEDVRDNTTAIVELSSTSDLSDIGSSWNSPVASPTGSSQIVELDPDSPNSLTNGSVTDEEVMEFE